MTRSVRVLSLYEGFFAGGARILHSDVVAGLHAGGQDHRILSIASRARREQVVQPMFADARYRSLRAAGVSVRSLARTAAAEPLGPQVFSFRQLRTAARAIAEADVVLSLKEQPLGLVLALADAQMLPPRPLAVCLHRSDPDHAGAAGGWLSDLVSRGVVTSVISCAHATDTAYAPLVAGAERHVVANGIDLGRYRPAEGTSPLRDELGIPTAAPVIAYAARFDAMKDPQLFLRSVAAHAALRPDAHYVMCGAGMTRENDRLRQVMTDAGAPADRVHVLGIRDDMPDVYAAADIVALTSAFGEASPLCLIEGAACGATPVSTDVGDAARRIAGFGVVTSRDPGDIAGAWQHVLANRDGYRQAALAARASLGRAGMIAAYGEVVESLPRRVRVRAAA